MRFVLTYLTGLVFGLGIALSGMANPAKVLNFFDIAGTWDPSLIFVMGGAMLTTMAGYFFILKRPTPAFDTAFHLPQAKAVDAKLIGGSALFGIGWGIAGFCPGGALPALGTLTPNVFLFVAALLVGMWLARIAPRYVSGAPKTA